MIPAERRAQVRSSPHVCFCVWILLCSVRRCVRRSGTAQSVGEVAEKLDKIAFTEIRLCELLQTLYSDHVAANNAQRRCL